MKRGHWRLAATSPNVLSCAGEANSSQCKGGSHVGSCSNGASGPLCQVCDNTSHFYDANEYGNPEYDCKECPSGGGVATGWAVLLVVLVALAVLIGLLLRQPPAVCRPLSIRLNALLRYLASLGLQSKCKMALSFYQVVTVIDSTYGVVLPDVYRRWMSVFAFVGKLDWASITLPEQCLFPQGFKQGLIFRAIAPLLLIGCFLFLGQAASFLGACVECDFRTSLKKRVKRGLLLAMPASILTTFIFVPGVSAAIFSAWSCESFPVDADRKVCYAHHTPAPA